TQSMRRRAAAGGFTPRAAPVVLYKGIGLKWPAVMAHARNWHTPRTPRTRRTAFARPKSPLRRSFRRAVLVRAAGCPNAAQPELETISRPFLRPAAGIGKGAVVRR